MPRRSLAGEAVERLGLLQVLLSPESLVALVNDSQERRETCKQGKQKIQTGMVPTHVQLPRAKGRVKVRQRRDPATGTPPVGSARGMRCAAGRFILSPEPRAGLVTSRQTFVRRCREGKKPQPLTAGAS